ncbi:MAG: hypothetical protein ACTSR8_18360 [Promethearchaeota archaeon]
MRTINVLHPNDFTYPLSKELFEDSKIIYHGTSNCFCENIENKGWIPHDIPYDIKDLKFIYEHFYSLRYETRGSAAIFQYIKEENKRLPSFTKIYWAARNYSRNRGGEIINNIITVINEFEAFVRNKANQQAHKEFLKSTSNLFYGSIGSCLELLENEEYLDSTLEKMLKIKSKYEKAIFIHSYPVVYVLEVKPETFPKWTNIKFWEEENNQILYKTQQGLDLRPNDAIQSKQIIIRINFPNGVQKWDPSKNIPLPLSWEKESFLKWYNKRMKRWTLIYSERIEDYDEEFYNNLDLDYIGKKLIEAQIIPNIKSAILSNFEITFPNFSVLEKTRKDVNFKYNLKNELLGDSEKELKIDVISYISKQRGAYFHEILHYNRAYPI